MIQKSNRNPVGVKPAAAKKTRPAQTATPNFHLVGEPYGTLTTIGTLLRFARVEPRGRSRWYVEARPLEWVLVPGHIVWLTPGGHLQCDCRQGVAGRACDHALAVRQIGTIKPSRAADPRQIEIDLEVPPTVRIATPRGRFRVEYHVTPASHRTRPHPVPAGERADG